MKNRSKIFTHILPAIFLVLICSSPVRADRGSYVLRKSVAENIHVYDAGQKAIIGWNNNQEIMILSTDKYVSKDAKVLEFMPLPSKPSRVEKADFKSFGRISALIGRHRPRAYFRPKNGGSKRSKGGANVRSSVEVVFHKKIGAHDITIAKTRDLDGFIEWIKKFVAKNGMQYHEADVKTLKPIVRGYLNDGYHYYVFDVIELTTDKKSIEPILYQFESKKVYFPLRVTQLSEGFTHIALYLFTPFKTDIWGTGTGFVSGFYTIERKPSYKHPVKFEIRPREMKKVVPEISKLFKNHDAKVWFSTAKFDGETSRLTRDFIIRPIITKKKEAMSAKTRE